MTLHLLTTACYCLAWLTAIVYASHPSKAHYDVLPAVSVVLFLLGFGMDCVSYFM